MDVKATAELLKLWLPASLTMATDWTRPILFNLFTSHNLKSSVLAPEDVALEEDAVGLSVMSLNLLLFATAYGFNGAIDSYASVSFGAGDRAELFAVLLRQLMLLCVLAIGATLLLMNAESVLLAIGVRVELASRTSHLLQLMGPAVPGDFAYDCIARWMRGQQMHRHVSVCSVLGLGLNLAVNLMYSSPLEPTRGPITALVTQNSVLPFLLVASYACSPEAQRLSLAVLKAPPSADLLCGPPLWRQTRTALAAMVWTCAELWAWEVQVFEAAHLGTGNAAAYTLLSSTYSLLICVFPVSVASAASALMGEALGQRKPQRALRTLRAACVLTLLLVLIYTAPMYLGRSAVAALLCGGVVEVGTAYTRALPLVLSMHFLDGLFNVFKQWCVVRRKQAFGAAMSLVVYYGIGVPIGVYLAFWRGWGLLGLWAGLGMAVFLGAVAAGVQTVIDIADLVAAEPLVAEDVSEMDDDDTLADYVHADVLLGQQAQQAHRGARSIVSKPGAWAFWWQTRAGYLLWLCLLLAPGLATFVVGVSTPVVQPAAVSPSSTKPTAPPPTAVPHRVFDRRLLRGASQCTWSTGGAFYEYPFTAYWNATSGDYGWEVRIADRAKAVEGTNVGRRLLPSENEGKSTLGYDNGFGALRFGGNLDVYDRAYDKGLDPNVEVGWAAWLVPPEVRPDPRHPGEWTSFAFVGTRVRTQRLAPFPMCTLLYTALRPE